MSYRCSAIIRSRAFGVSDLAVGGRSKQNQVRPIFFDARQSLSLFWIVDCQPSAQEQNHFLYGFWERDNDLRVPCNLSDVEALPSMTFRADPNENLPHQVAPISQVKVSFVSCADYGPIAQGCSHLPIYIVQEHYSLCAPLRTLGGVQILLPIAL